MLLLWAPRHPERFGPVTERLRSAGLRTATRAADRWPERDDAAFVIDTLGELPAFFAVSDVAFVGGSLQDIGGHNLLEPAVAGVPVVTGPHLHNFTDIARGMREANPRPHDHRGLLRLADVALGELRQQVNAIDIEAGALESCRSATLAAIQVEDAWSYRHIALLSGIAAARHKS